MTESHQLAAPVRSRVIFENAHYTACAMRDGSLVVTRKCTLGGKRLIGPQAAEWINAIETALDSAEGAALCRAVLAA